MACTDRSGGGDLIGALASTLDVLSAVPAGSAFRYSSAREGSFRMHDGQVDVTGGVDTHSEQHVAAVADAVGMPADYGGPCVPASQIARASHLSPFVRDL